MRLKNSHSYETDGAHWDDDEVDDAVEKPRDRIVNDGIRGLLFGWMCSGGSGWSTELFAGRIEEESSSDGSEA